MQDFVIDVHNLSKVFDGKKVVNHIDIRVPKGKVYGFLGPNGSGKTTTIRMICGLLSCTTGKGTCLGHSIITESEMIRKKTGYMTQKFSYWSNLTVRENLNFVAEMFHLSKRKSCVDDCLERMGLLKRQDDLAGNLSGGWKQRLSLAACTLHKPDLLLLDEPTAGVDPKARREFWEEIHKMAISGLTVLVTTHYMDEAQRCHEIIYINNGSVITKGTVDDVIKNTGITTWVALGTNFERIIKDLDKNPFISSIAYFSDGLHVSGINSKKLKEAISPYSSDFEWRLITPGMEDAFIYYMNKATEVKP